MRIHVSKDVSGTFVLSFDDTVVTLSAKDLKVLLLEVMQAFSGGGNSSAVNETEQKRFFARLGEADDIGLQTLFQVAEHDDMVALIKLTEANEQLREKLFRNMSDNSRKIYVEDAAYRFREAVPADQVNIALLRLSQICDTLRDEGRADI